MHLQLVYRSVDILWIFQKLSSKGVGRLLPFDLMNIHANGPENELSVNCNSYSQSLIFLLLNLKVAGFTICAVAVKTASMGESTKQGQSAGEFHIL